jgi:DNA-binding GntR family transcriptional regulator
VQTALDDGSVTAMLVANRAFHFGLFELSPLGVMRADVERLWNASEPYRATYLWLPATRRRIVREHAQMLEALERGDRGRLVQVANRHRDAACEVVTELLALELR